MGVLSWAGILIVAISLSLLTLAFIVLKLTDAISWSWVWVLSPLGVQLGAVFLVELLEQWAREREKKERYEAFRKTGH